MSSKFIEFYKRKRGKETNSKNDKDSSSSRHIAQKNNDHTNRSKHGTRNVTKEDKKFKDKSPRNLSNLSVDYCHKTKQKAETVFTDKVSRLGSNSSTDFNVKGSTTKKTLTVYDKKTKTVHSSKHTNSQNLKISKKERKKKKRKWKKKQTGSEMASSSATEIFDSGSRYFTEHQGFHSTRSTLHNHRKCSTADHQKKDDKDVAVVLELPGYYYDKEKKKYFKILPNDSCIGNSVTEAGIKKKEKEEARKSHLKNHLSSNTEIGRRKTQPLYTSCLPCLTCRLQQGKFTAGELDYTLHKMRLRNINKNPQTKIKIYADVRRDWLERLEHASQLEMVENKRIVGLYSIKDSMIQRILWLKLTDKPKSSQKDRLSLSIDPSPSCRYYQSAVKISSMRLIDKDSVLYTGMVYTGTPESLVFIKGLGESSSRYEVYSLGQKATWSCAWNSHANQFSVGSEKCGLLLDVQTRRLWEINTNNSDVLCQVFSKQNGQCLYSGTRKSQIFTHDLRSISTYSVSHLTMSSSVCGLQLLQNDIHLLASDVKGQVKLWDLRNKKVVNEYAGMKNEYLRIPIHVDQSEEVVYGVDQDGYTRLWCLKTGELFKTIPPPLSTSYDFFPSVLYSKTWNDKPGNAGLLMGLGDRIFVYSDYQEE